MIFEINNLKVNTSPITVFVIQNFHLSSKNLIFNSQIIAKKIFMSTVEMKAQINEYLEEVDDSFMQAIHAMLDTYVTKQTRL